MSQTLSSSEESRTDSLLPKTTAYNETTASGVQYH